MACSWQSTQLIALGPEELGLRAQALAIEALVGRVAALETRLAILENGQSPRVEQAALTDEVVRKSEAAEAAPLATRGDAPEAQAEDGDGVTFETAAASLLLAEMDPDQLAERSTSLAPPLAHPLGSARGVGREEALAREREELLEMAAQAMATTEW